MTSGEIQIRVRYAETDRMVLTKVEVRYLRPARYDDVLTIRTHVQRVTFVRIDHRYEVLRDGELLAEGSSTLACVNREGRPQPLPDFLRPDPK
jgi:acyl-CoA thioester hydrolase